MADPNIEWEMTVVLLVAVKDEYCVVFEKLRSIALAFEAPTGDSNLAGVFYLTHQNVLIKALLAKVPPPAKGGDAAAWVTTMLAERYRPYVLVMVGLCAGNPDENLEFGDVVIATSTLRHDHGKVECQDFWRRLLNRLFRSSVTADLKFEHQFHLERIDEKLRNQLLTFIKDYQKNLPTTESGRPTFRIVHGIMSTCNQVTKIPGVFAYLKRRIVGSLAEDDRSLKALEMEAYAVAYAARSSEIATWLVVKGVCDHADKRKDDSHHLDAVRNAFGVTLDLLRDVLVPHFLVNDKRRIGLSEENFAKQAFDLGDIKTTREKAMQAHMLGRRSMTTRRRHLHALGQFGEYDAAIAIIADYRRTQVFYDHVAIEAEATILARHGQYKEVSDALSDERIKGHRQLLYLRALNEILWKESARPDGGSAVAPSPSHLERAKNLLSEAVGMEGPPPWWISVNLFWVLRLLKAPEEELQTEFERALEFLDSVIKRSSAGAPRLYRLFLRAAADRRSDFDEGAAQMIRDAPQVQVALELVDLVYARLEILHRRGILSRESYWHYWAEICRWLWAARTVGRPVREVTTLAMKRWQP